ncbi:MAG: VanZ family protein [Deltaproteobacteria bacterium]|nr:VanZ family protein [Deltaproteobacteria bacterium]
MENRQTTSRAWLWVGVYALLVLGTQSYVPLLSDFLEARGWFQALLTGSHLLAGLVLLWFFYFYWRIRAPAAYTLLAVLVLLFLAAFVRIGQTADHFHFLEHGLMFFLVWRAVRFKHSGLVWLGRTFLLCLLFAGMDEGLQGLLPNREAEWKDLWTNIFGLYLAAGLLLLAAHYKKA